MVRWSSAFALPCLALGVVALGRALQIFDGFYHPTALNWALAAFGLLAAGTLTLSGFRPESR